MADLYDPQPATPYTRYSRVVTLLQTVQLPAASLLDLQALKALARTSALAALDPDARMTEDEPVVHEGHAYTALDLFRIWALDLDEAEQAEMLVLMTLGLVSLAWQSFRLGTVHMSDVLDAEWGLCFEQLLGFLSPPTGQPLFVLTEACALMGDWAALLEPDLVRDLTTVLSLESTTVLQRLLTQGHDARILKSSSNAGGTGYQVGEVFQVDGSSELALGRVQACDVIYASPHHQTLYDTTVARQHLTDFGSGYTPGEASTTTLTGTGSALQLSIDVVGPLNPLQGDASPRIVLSGQLTNRSYQRKPPRGTEVLPEEQAPITRDLLAAWLFNGSGEDSSGHGLTMAMSIDGGFHFWQDSVYQANNPDLPRSQTLGNATPDTLNHGANAGTFPGLSTSGSWTLQIFLQPQATGADNIFGGASILYEDGILALGEGAIPASGPGAGSVSHWLPWAIHADPDPGVFVLIPVFYVLGKLYQLTIIKRDATDTPPVGLDHGVDEVAYYINGIRVLNSPLSPGQSVPLTFATLTMLPYIGTIEIMRVWGRALDEEEFEQTSPFGMYGLDPDDTLACTLGFDFFFPDDRSLVTLQTITLYRRIGFDLTLPTASDDAFMALSPGTTGYRDESIDVDTLASPGYTYIVDFVWSDAADVEHHAVSNALYVQEGSGDVG